MKVLEKVIQSNLQPQRQDVVWIDTSDPTNPMVKIYDNGEWKLASESGVPSDVVRGVGIKHIINIDKDDFDTLVDKDPETIYLVKDDPTRGHELVDIGQTDDEGYHILWATKNIGAETEYDDGKYFAFGDTVGYYAEDGHNFNWNNCPYFDGDDENPHFSKYNAEDGLTNLEPEDDAAHVQWGGKWQMPNMEEAESLLRGFLYTNEITRYNNIPYCIVSDGGNEKALITTSGHFNGTERTEYHDETPNDYIWAYVLSSYLYNTSSGSSLKRYAYVSYDENGYIDEISGDSLRRCVGSTIRPIIKVKDISELEPTYEIYIGGIKASSSAEPQPQQGGMTVIRHMIGDSNITANPNEFHIIPSCNSLTLSLNDSSNPDTINYYIVMFTFGGSNSDPNLMPLSVPDTVKWANGIIPDITRGTYQLSILEGCATLTKFELV